MKHRKPESYILLAFCSSCKGNFRDGAARHMLGSYPMEQFCTYRCAENFLENNHGLQQAIPLPAPITYVKDQFQHIEKRTNSSLSVLLERIRDY